MTNVYLISFGVSFFASIIVFLFSKLKKRIYKFIPSMILFIMSIFFIIEANLNADDWGYLGYLIICMISTTACTITLIVAALLDLRKKRKK